MDEEHCFEVIVETLHALLDAVDITPLDTTRELLEHIGLYLHDVHDILVGHSIVSEEISVLVDRIKDTRIERVEGQYEISE